MIECCFWVCIIKKTSKGTQFLDKIKALLSVKSACSVQLLNVVLVMQIQNIFELENDGEGALSPP
jgi:hypothetical protein